MIGRFTDRNTQQVELASLQASVTALDQMVAALERRVAEQARDIATLQKAAELRDEEFEQLRGDYARLELQAARDLDEMRAANTALAAAALLKQPTRRAAPDDF